MAGFYNAFGGSTGYTGKAPASVVGTTMTNEGFQLQQPFLEDLFGTAGETFFETSVDDAGVETKTLRIPEQYAGETIAGFTPEQETAFNMLTGIGAGGLAATGQAGSGQYMTRAREFADLVGQEFDSATAEKYMNPYLENVTRQAEDEALRRYRTEIEPKLGAEAAAAGAFGGSRAALLESEGQRNLLRQMGDIRERGLAAGFDQGRRAFEAQKAREQGLAGFYGQLAEAAPRIGAMEAGLVSSVGEQRRGIEQARLDRAEKEFIEQRDAPMRQLAQYQSILQGFPYSPSTYEVKSTYTPQPTFGQQLISGIGTGASLYGSFGGFNPAGRRRYGGLVSRRSGGQVQGGLAGLERHQNNNRTLTQTLADLFRQDYKPTPLTYAQRHGGYWTDQDPLSQRNWQYVKRDEDAAKLIEEGALGDLAKEPTIVDTIMGLMPKSAKIDPMTGRPSLQQELAVKEMARERVPTQNVRGAPRLPVSGEFPDNKKLEEIQNELATMQRREQNKANTLALLPSREQAQKQATGKNILKGNTLTSKAGEAITSAINDSNIQQAVKRQERKALLGGVQPPDHRAIEPMLIQGEEETGAHFTKGEPDPEKTGKSITKQDNNNNKDRKELDNTINRLSAESGGAESVGADNTSTDAGPEKQPPIDINIDSLSFRGIMESGRAYDDALNDYIKLLEKKDPEELRTKADDARRQDLWLTAAKFFSKMGSAAPSSLGASGFSSILEAAMKSAPESIDEVKKIQKQFREEVALADKLKEDVAKEKVTLEQARELMRLKRWGVGSDLLTARSNLIKSGEFDPQEWATGIKAMEAFMGKLNIQTAKRRSLMANFSELVQLYPNNIPGVVATVTKNYRSKNPSGGGSATGGNAGGKTARDVDRLRVGF